MARVSIKVDLSDFFSDGRRLVRVVFDPAWTCIDQLRKRIEEVFGLTNLHFRTMAGDYLPPQQKVTALDLLPVVKAFSGDSCNFLMAESPTSEDVPCTSSSLRNVTASRCDPASSPSTHTRESVIVALADVLPQPVVAAETSGSIEMRDQGTQTESHDDDDSEEASDLEVYYMMFD